MAQPGISIVIPCFNEEAKLENNIDSLVSSLENWERDWEIVLINDGSTDGTREAVEALASSDSRIRYISYKENRGRGYALRSGFGAAIGDIVVSTEADLSWGADIIIRMVTALEESDRDIIVASPFMREGKLVNVPFRRALISRIGNKFLTSTIPADITMVSGMTRCYRREVLDAIEIESEGKEFHVEVLFKALVLGYRIGEIPATLKWESHKEGSGKRRAALTIRRMVWGHMILWMLERPIFIFGSLGVLLLLAGLIGGVYITYLRFAGELNPERPLMTLVVILILGGFQILAFGFMSILLVRVRNEIIRTQRENRAILKKLED
ncbi:MAG: glycosyltransferase [Candidatus Latescibacteria bacterium]|nr:glycosyltransferase [Candidatus Latescibacterota bacterium]NIM21781.1 glycosyltransferase [Candidatus Latescibacterota bacterium]NIM65919.1 glycosyltransferase [Candidatus Latescibacterota bacterium]NIO02664.1 glycosyltransferase [Candidatus Latescibacterota bacterium]NIO29645.1 glycosyltransferase [Candidatus Latescibacterota bacterium]